MTIYKEFISIMVKELSELHYLFDYDGNGIEEAIGINMKNINKIERNLKIKLPELYKEFLLQTGNSYIFGEDFYLGIDKKFLIQKLANMALKYDKSKLYPLKNKMVFQMQNNNSFHYFHTNKGDNPAVYRYHGYGQWNDIINENGDLNDEDKEMKEHYEKANGLRVNKKVFDYYYYPNNSLLFEKLSDYFIEEILVLIHFNNTISKIDKKGNRISIRNKEKTKKDFNHISKILKEIIP